jgi:hypothetical protein
MFDKIRTTTKAGIKSIIINKPKGKHGNHATVNLCVNRVKLPIYANFIGKKDGKIKRSVLPSLHRE